LSLPDGEKTFAFAEGSLAGKAVLLRHEEDGGAVWQLRGMTAASAGLAVTNIFFKDDEDVEWAVAMWKSLENDEG